MSTGITVKEAKDLLKSMQKITPANPKLDDDLEMSIKEAVVFMAPGLIQLGRRGCTSKELAVGLAERGFSIKPGTLNRYLNDYLAADKRSAESKTATRDNGGKGRKLNAKIPFGVSTNPKPGSVTVDEKSESPVTSPPPDLE